MRIYIWRETIVPTLVVRTRRTSVEMQATWLGWLTLSPRISVQRLVKDEMDKWYWRPAWRNRYY